MDEQPHTATRYGAERELAGATDPHFSPRHSGVNGHAGLPPLRWFQFQVCDGHAGPPSLRTGGSQSGAEKARAKRKPIPAQMGEG